MNNAGIARRNQAAQDRMLAEFEALMTGGERHSLGPTSTLSDEEWDRMIRVHLYGTFHCTREVIGAGIRVNAIAPGWIRTPMVREEVDPRLLPLLIAQVPAGTMGEPDHVAALALHLYSDEAAYTTGQVVSPNGGLYT